MIRGVKMNTDKILKMINQEETEYFNKGKDYSVFSKHFNLKSFLNRHVIDVILSSPFIILPTIFFVIKSLSLLNYTWLPIVVIVSVPLCMAFYLFLSYVLHRFYFKTRFLYTKNNAEKQEAFLRKTLMLDFDEQKINNSLLNHLKIELSEEQYIELISANKEPTYKNVKDLIAKEVSIQSIKDSQKNVILTSDEIKEYSKSHDKIKLNAI